MFVSYDFHTSSRSIYQITLCLCEPGNLKQSEMYMGMNFSTSGDREGLLVVLQNIKKLYKNLQMNDDKTIRSKQRFKLA